MTAPSRRDPRALLRAAADVLSASASVHASARKRARQEGGTARSNRRRRVSVSTKDRLPLRAGDDGLAWREWELHAGVELITAAQTEKAKRVWVRAH